MIRNWYNQIPPGQTTYYAKPHALPARPYHIIHHSLPAKPYHIPCHARQAILHIMPSPMLCLSGHNHTPYDARQAIPYTMWCLPGHTIPCDARTAIPYPMPGPPGHTIIPCDARQAILHSMRRPPVHTIHHASQDIQYTMPSLGR